MNQENRSAGSLLGGKRNPASIAMRKDHAHIHRMRRELPMTALKKPVNLSLHEDLSDWARRYAEKNHLTVSGVVEGYLRALRGGMAPLFSPTSKLCPSSMEEADISRLLAEAAAAGATEIHISVGRQEAIIRMRVGEDLRSIAHWESLHATRCIDVLLGSAGGAKADDTGAFEADLNRFDKPDAPLIPDGVQSIRIHGTETMTGRNVRISMRSMAENRCGSGLSALGYTDDQIASLRNSCQHGKLIIISGRRGSGRSATLAEILAMQAEHRAVSMVSPLIDGDIPGVGLFQISPSRLSDMVPTLLRLNQDIVGIDDLHDARALEDVGKLLHAGIGVVLTVCAQTPGQAVQHLLALNTSITSSQIGAVVQTHMIETPCPHCATDHYDADRDFCHLGAERIMKLDSNIEGAELIRFRNPQGCVACCHTGWSGRSIVADVQSGTVVLDHPGSRMSGPQFSHVGVFDLVKRIRTGLACPASTFHLRNEMLGSI